MATSDYEDMLLRALTEADAAELRRIRSTPEVAEWWEPPEHDFPFEDDSVTRLVVLEGGEVAGMVQYEEETDPKYRHAGIDLFLDPALHGKGLGTAVVLAVLKLLVERGHHRVTIDPAADNAAAIRCYAKAGFREVGVMRQAERDGDGQGWHDVLLMEWVSGRE